LALAIDSREAAPFDDESLGLLRGLADDMSFGLDMLGRLAGVGHAENRPLPHTAAGQTSVRALRRVLA
jgi:hypothetical protein